MEKEGISIDRSYLGKLEKAFESELSRLIRGILEKYGEEVNRDTAHSLRATPGDYKHLRAYESAC